MCLFRCWFVEIWFLCVIINVCVFVSLLICRDLVFMCYYFKLYQKYESTVKFWKNLEECSDIPFLYEWIWCTRVLVLFILDDTLAISANNKWSDERLGLTKTVIYCVLWFLWINEPILLNLWTESIEKINWLALMILNCFKLN